MVGFVQKARWLIRNWLTFPTIRGDIAKIPPALADQSGLLTQSQSMLAQSHSMLAHNHTMLVNQSDFLMHAQMAQAIASARNPLNKFGAKFFSQTDEDGITGEILRRIGIEQGTFLEIGVGDGTENNTLLLLATGWRGVWIGGQDLCFDHSLNPDRLTFVKTWVTRENIVDTISPGSSSLTAATPDVLSLDIDGNDLYVLEEMLNHGLTPKLAIVEYNAKFPPPIEWCIEYNPAHTWEGTDYFGASLESFRTLFRKHGYTLVCCNAVTGANAFFVRNDYLGLFPDIPDDIRDIFFPPRYLLFLNYGHRPSPQTIERMLRP